MALFSRKTSLVNARMSHAVSGAGGLPGGLRRSLSVDLDFAGRLGNESGCLWFRYEQPFTNAAQEFRYVGYVVLSSAPNTVIDATLAASRALTVPGRSRTR